MVHDRRSDSDDHRMTPELLFMLRQWLIIGTEAQREHARHRLSLADATDYKPPERPEPKPAATGVRIGGCCG